MKKNLNFTIIPIALSILLTPITSPGALPGRRSLRGNVPAAISRLQPLKLLPATNRMYLVLGLPLRNPESLTNLLANLYNPASTNFHNWLTSDQFTEKFGPTEEDYQKVVHFAEIHGMKIIARHSNRMLLDVAAEAADVEKAFQVKLRVYRHPTENRTFFAPDVEPSVDAGVPLLHVAGLNDFTIPQPLGLHVQDKISEASTNQTITPYATGSGPGGSFRGGDYRAAYVPGVTNTGAGQYIAIVDVGGPYYMKDIYMYETNAGLPTNIVITNILLSGWSGIPNGDSQDDGEETLDIDMAISMAPGATILNYEGEAHDVFNQIAIDNKAKQMTLSYGFGIDASIIQTFQQFAAQGQSFSQASGDGGADLDGGTGLTGNPYATIVGGTGLTTSGAGGPWQSETTWGGSGGGISGYGIPDWQQGIATSSNQGSPTYRNYPDVAMLADTVIWWYYKNGQGGAVGGTSAASPLWAGFMALVNQQAETYDKPAAGFVNPAIYSLGKGPYSTYTKSFHDIIAGDNTNVKNPLKYYARPGYDLCTGWGTPTGINAINALAGIGTNDFTFYASPSGFNVLPGSIVSTTITVTRLNGLGGSINLSLSGLPTGMSASLSPSSTAGTSQLTLTIPNSAAIGAYPVTITGSSGDLTRSIALNLIVSPPIPGAMPVTLSSFYNRAGIYSDGRTFSGGLDGGGYAYSANQIGSSENWGGVKFNLGPANTSDVVTCAGQTIPLPSGNFSTLLLLTTAVQGNQLSQTFTVTYTDNSTTTFAQNFSDWAKPQSYSGETIVAKMPYRDYSGGQDSGTPVNTYGHSFTLDPTKTVKSIKLPNDGYLIVLAISLANTPVSADLAFYYNRAGIYTDGTTFTNPPTRGIDGSGWAYSATLLGNSQTWSNTLFNFGPANATNVISAAGQTLTLPAGKYSVLHMLATGVQGNQASQPFIVNYSDGTTSFFSQSLSDWYSPQNYPGESKAVAMGRRNGSDGGADRQIFYLYGYSFRLNSAKTVESIRLPNNGDVIVLAVSLVPNWQPVFAANPFSEPGIIAGQAYSGTIATNTYDLNGDSMTFSKSSGPAWLNVAANGALSGTPHSGDVGVNTFVVRAGDSGNLFDQSTLNIAVIAAPPIVSKMSVEGSNLSLNWTGGVAPYQVQMTTNLSNPDWENLGGTISGNNLIILPTNAATFYRILGQ
jgi:hypothetical protein